MFKLKHVDKVSILVVFVILYEIFERYKKRKVSLNALLILPMCEKNVYFYESGATVFNHFIIFF
jgi:hypothetical protein